MDLLHERGIEITHETVRFWWNGLGTILLLRSDGVAFRRRERAMLWFRRMRGLQKFAAVQGSIHSQFNSERHLHNRQILKERRAAARAGWRRLCAA